MARYRFPPLSDLSPRRLYRLNAATGVRVGYDHATHIADISVSDVNIRARWDDVAWAWSDIHVVIPNVPDALVMGRVNRVLSGFDAPRLQSYRGRTVARLPRRAVDLPLALRGRVLNGTWSWETWAGGLAAHAAASVPASAPAAPQPDPQPAPQAAQPAPQAERKPAPPVFTAPKSDPRGLLRYPAKSMTPEVIMDDTSAETLRSFVAYHADPERDGISAILLAGPSGTGKTQAVDRIAAEHGLGVYGLNAMAAADFTDWAGRTGLDKDGTRFVWTPLIEVIRADGPYAGQPRIVRIDEFNRTPSTTAANFWLPVLEEGRINVAEAGETIEVDRAVMFFLTMNEGTGYSGTVDVDTAIRDRMTDNVRLTYLAPDKEVSLIIDRLGRKTNVTRQQAQQVVNAANQVRHMAEQHEVRSGVSTRNILKAVSLMAYGRSLRSACTTVWALGYPDEAQRERVTTAINSAITD